MEIYSELHSDETSSIERSLESSAVDEDVDMSFIRHSENPPRTPDLLRRSREEEDALFSPMTPMGFSRKPSLKKIGSQTQMLMKNVTFSDQHGMELENVREIPGRIKLIFTAWQGSVLTILMGLLLFALITSFTFK